ncbi:hypothetical protein M9Y10_003731 [Tritrichomonas musculus]|uniref:RGS domain-containing protein n=1 Tax=Tritrichomonas musculus TaxID=1915356 RepID=A0ABR2JQ58_9EUKA
MDSLTLIKKYVEENKKMQESLLDFLESDENCFENLKNFIEEEKIRENKEKFVIFINILSKISVNHNRSYDFINKIEQIFTYYQIDIKNFFSNNEIYQTFQDDKRILLFLFDQKGKNEQMNRTMTCYVKSFVKIQLKNSVYLSTKIKFHFHMK